MKTSILAFLAIIIGFTACTSVTQSSGISGNHPKSLQLIDQTYDPYIQTALLYPSFGDPADDLLPAVIPMGQWNLLMAFDDLSNQHQSYYMRLIHCNHDWSKSTLLDLDFLNEFNEFPVNNYEYSINTHIPYIHYWAQVPPVKLPGNYVLVVYRNNRDDIVITKRFMVYDNRVAITREGNLVGAGTIADLNQQINFTVHHKDLEVLNPMQDMNVTIRQNQRWDNIVPGIKPTFIRTAQQELEYRFFDPDKMFKGGNEFRFFDLRSLNSPGRNIERINQNVKPFEAYLFKDKSRAHEAYAQYNDLNGQFFISNFDFNDPASTNYVMVHFSLAHPEPVDGSVYVTGELTHWLLNEDNKMHYDSVAREYQLSLLLKQGWYDYQYYVRSDEVRSYYFEGSHFETENTYEIFIYHRPFQPRADLLIGYVRFEQNPR